MGEKFFMFGIILAIVIIASLGISNLFWKKIENKNEEKKENTDERTQEQTK